MGGLLRGREGGVMDLTLGGIHQHSFASFAVFAAVILLFSGTAAGAAIEPLDGFPAIFNERIDCSRGSDCTVIDEAVNDETPEDINADFSGSAGGDDFQIVARALTSATPSGPLNSPFGSVEANAIGSIEDSAQIIIHYYFVVQGPKRQPVASP